VPGDEVAVGHLDAVAPGASADRSSTSASARPTSATAGTTTASSGSLGLVGSVVLGVSSVAPVSALTATLGPTQAVR
jgi:hypothetical protein